MTEEDEDALELITHDPEWSDFKQPAKPLSYQARLVMEDIDNWLAVMPDEEVVNVS